MKQKLQKRVKFELSIHKCSYLSCEHCFRKELSRWKPVHVSLLKSLAMAMLTRVPLVYSALKPTSSPPLPFRQCHKCCLVPISNSLQILGSSISPTSQKGFRSRRVRALSVVPMADSGPTTVLVTGAGGRTGNSAVFSLLACLQLVWLLREFQGILRQNE